MVVSRFDCYALVIELGIWEFFAAVWNYVLGTIWAFLSQDDGQDLQGKERQHNCCKEGKPFQSNKCFIDNITVHPH